MTSLKQKIKELQKKPYKTKLRILWGTVIVSAIFLIIIWIITIQLRDKITDTNHSIDKFKTIFENAKSIKIKP